MKHLFTFVLTLCLTFYTLAQTPQGINYQGVARNSSGVELANQAIGIELSILDGSPTGTAVYTETHALTTDANGLFALVIGAGTPSVGTFAGINWAVGGSKWLKMSMDASGGTSYLLIGTSQLLSVPYALYAGSVSNNGGKQTLVLSDDITDAQAITTIASQVGPNTQEIKIVGTTNLTTVDLSGISTAINIEIANNAALTTVNLSGLTRCDGEFKIQNNPLLSNLNVNALAKITTGGLEISNSGLTSLNFPLLTKCNGYFIVVNNAALSSIALSSITSAQSIDIEANAVLSSVSLSNLSTVTNGNLIIANLPSISSISLPQLNSASDGVWMSNNPNLPTISLPALTQCGNINFTNNTILSTFSAPALVTSGDIYVQMNIALTTVDLSALSTSRQLQFQNNTLLASLSFPSLASTGTGQLNFYGNGLTSISLPALTTFGSYFGASGNKLPSSEINAILNMLVSIAPAITGKNIELIGQSPMAPPTGQGITDMNTLITNGNSVMTD